MTKRTVRDKNQQQYRQQGTPDATKTNKCGRSEFNTDKYTATQCNALYDNSTRRSAMQSGTIQYSLIQHDTAQCNTTRYNAAQGTCCDKIRQSQAETREIESEQAHEMFKRENRATLIRYRNRLKLLQKLFHIHT